MDAILKSFSLGFLLRSVFAGTFFVLIYYMDTNGTSAEITLSPENIFSVGLVFALVAGVTVYGVHRSVVFPWIEWLLSADRSRRLRREWKTLISENAINDVVRRWDSRAEQGKEAVYRAEQIASWGDYIHLQYASAWCIIFGLLVGAKFGGKWPPPHWRFFAALALFFCIAASISAWRSRSLEEHWSPVEIGKGEQTEPSGPPNQGG